MPERWNKAPYLLTEFGGLYTIAGGRAAVPQGKAQQAYNVSFYPGRVCTRPGFTQVATGLATDPVSLKEYVQQDLSTRRLLMMTKDASIYAETGSYAFSAIWPDNFAPSSLQTSLRMNSTTLFGREYIATGFNGVTSYTAPMRYDGTNVYRVSPGGPGINASAAAAGVGTISAGKHKLRVCFRTADGFITPSGRPSQWTATGTNAVTVSSIPTGPAYVTGRILALTPADSNDFYYVPGSGMDIRDNTTTSVSFDFDDVTLMNGTPISVASDPTTDVMNLIELPEQSFVTSYHDRLVWLGERGTIVKNGDDGVVGSGKDGGFYNMSFDGGWTGGIPNGWTQIIAGAAQGTGQTGAFGDYLMITGSGANRDGMINNIANATTFLPADSSATAFTVRLRMRRNATLATGGLYVYITDVSAASTVEPAGLQFIDVTTLSNTEWRVVELTLAGPTTSNSNLRICAGRPNNSGTNKFTSGGIVYIDWMQIRQTGKAYEPSLARLSRARQPDAYDGQTGFQYVAQDNGQRLTSAFVLNDALYYVKERSLHVTRDDGSREPASWPVDLVSSEVGSPSAKGVAFGDKWVIIAGRAGLFYFNGSSLVCLSEDVRPTWQRINWIAGNLIQVHVDMDRKQIYVAVPIDSNTQANTIFCFQWTGSAPVQWEGVAPTARNDFSFWQVLDTLSPQVNAMATSERSDGTRHMLFAIAGTANFASKLHRLDDSASVDGAANLPITTSYETACFGGAGLRQNFKRLSMSLSGSGSLTPTLVGPNGFQPLVNLPVVTLSATPSHDVEYPVTNMTTDRASVQLFMSAGKFSLDRLALFQDWPAALGEKGRRA